MSEPAAPSRTKLCQSCGLRKPLDAFALKSGLLGATYGNICADCRTKKSKFGNLDDGSTSSTTQRTISAKEKIEIDVQNREAFEKENKEYYEERDKNQQIDTKHLIKKNEQALDQKKIRAWLEKAPKSADKTPVKEAPATPAVDPTSPITVSERERGFDSTRIAHDTAIIKTYRQSEFLHAFMRLAGKEKWLGSPQAAQTVQKAAERVLENKKIIGDAKTPQEQVERLESSKKPGSKR